MRVMFEGILKQANIQKESSSKSILVRKLKDLVSGPGGMEKARSFINSLSTSQKVMLGVGSGAIGATVIQSLVGSSGTPKQDGSGGGVGANKGRGGCDPIERKGARRIF